MISYNGKTPENKTETGGKSTGRHRLPPMIMFAAPSSGSGKTMITCAVLSLLKERGIRVSACKCGPDYIDPLFHEQVLGIPSGNADTFFGKPSQIIDCFEKRAVSEQAGLFVVEGVMGLYDGLGGIRSEGSSYDLARVLDCPVILVVDAKGMGRSAISMIKGFAADDRSHLIRGVIFNRMSRGMYKAISKIAAKETGVRVLGYVPEQKDLSFESRYLGLTLPAEQASLNEKLKGFAAVIAGSVDLSGICELAGIKEPENEPDEKADRKRDQASDHCHESEIINNENVNEKAPLIGYPGAKSTSLKLAVARDEAFCFYYRENLEMLSDMGVETVYFSPMHDRGLPEGISGLYIGGGYPERYAKELSSNAGMRLAVKKAVTGGLPTIAECGGFMYMHQRLKDGEGRIHELAGVVDGECFYTGRSVRFGYIEIEDGEGHDLKGHEFHYYDSTDNGDGCLIRKPVSGKSYRGIHVTENAWLGFPHLSFLSDPAFVNDFVNKMRRFCAAVESTGTGDATGR